MTVDADDNRANVVEELEQLVEATVQDHTLKVTPEMLEEAIRATVGKCVEARMRSITQNVQFGLIDHDEGVAVLEAYLRRNYFGERTRGWLRGFDIRASHVILFIGSKEYKFTVAFVAKLLMAKVYPLTDERALSIFLEVLMRVRQEMLTVIPDCQRWDGAPLWRQRVALRRLRALLLATNAGIEIVLCRRRRRLRGKTKA